VSAPERAADAATAADGAAAPPAVATPAAAPPGVDFTAWARGLPRNLLDSLGIEIVSMAPERVVLTMPVDARTHQPFGLLHGGASVALAETVASLGGAMHVDRARSMVVGLEINANHVRGVRSGRVTGVGAPLHLGRSTQVWEVRISDEAGRLVCVSRCTLAVVPLPAAAAPA
jgi:1,4-dihydroxy-2-naphthoyl-CoA hydrolase